MSALAAARDAAPLRRLRLGVLLLAAALAGCGGNDDGPACSAADLMERLAAASAGDVVTVGACRIEGSFRVPAGARLAGAGVDTSTIVGPAGTVAITLETGDVGTTLASLSVESNGCAAVVAQNRGGGPAGSVSIEDVTVHALRGIGLGAEGLAELVATRVQIAGAIAPEDADATVPPEAPYGCATADPATHGLLLVDVADAQLTDVRVSGFAAFGALLLRGATTWSGGTLADGVGTNLEVWGGEATLQDLSIERAHDGLAPIESYGAVISGQADVVGRAWQVIEQDATGVFVENATVRLEDLVASDNGFAGLWAQNATGLSVSGSATELRGNGFAGLALLDVTEASVTGATVASTIEKLGLSGPTTEVRAADGLHVVRSTGTFADLSLTDNPRVGLLLDLGGATTEGLAIDGVTVDSPGEALGAIAQNGTVLAGWDATVDRRGATAVNDPAFADVLGIAAGVGPSCIPSPANIDALGLAALLP